jgi:nucleoside phosphorylase
MNFAFVIAMECEADCVRAHTEFNSVPLYVSGIGKVNAAAAAQKAIIETGAEAIVNIGLSGGFDSKMEVGALREVVSAVEYDFDLAKLNGTRVGQKDEYDTPYIETATVGLYESGILATGDHFNDSENDFSLICEDLKASLRDMEGAAIAHVCKKAGVKCFLLKCVTNVAGKGLMLGQYEKNKSFALNVLTNAIPKYVDEICRIC